MDTEKKESPAYNLALQTKGFLDFIIGDIQSQFQSDLWVSEKESESTEFICTKPVDKY